MGRIKYEPISQLKQTLLDMRKRWAWVLLVILIDIAFIFIFSFVYTLYFTKILDYLQIIMQQTPILTSAVQSQDIASTTSIIQEVGRAVFEIKKIALMLAISVFVLWIGIQTVNWKNCFKIAKEKVSYINYLKSFTIMSAIWTAIISFIIYISVQMFFGKVSTMTTNPSDGTILNIGLLIALVVVGYFALVSFSIKGTIREVLKKTVMFSLSRSKVLVTYLLIIAIAAVINFIIMGLLKINNILGLVIGLILVLLLFVYGRIYMINVIQELDKDNNKVKKKRNV